MLRANLRSAAIPAPEADIERVLADGSLPRTVEVLRGLRDIDEEELPDYAARWEEEGPSPLGEPRAEASAGRRESIAEDDGLPADIASLAPLLRSGEVSPVELLERALARIAERDGQTNAFQCVLADSARAAAERAEREIAGGDWRGPLHGVPVAEKDLFEIQGTLTTAGAKAQGAKPDVTDSSAVAKLLAAGAVIVGKTRLPERAFWPGSANPHWGPTANPHDSGRDAGGSSSGSAAAVADGMSVAALGTDSGGSIRIPAALCGVVGLKPTYGRVSLAGCRALSWSLDHAGPLTRTVADAGLVLAALAGHDPRDPRTRRGAEWSPPDLEGASARGLRIGVLGADGTRKSLAGDAAMAAWRASCHALERGGAALVEIDLPEMSTLRAVNLAILNVEAATCHAAGLRAHYRDFGDPCRIRLLAGFGYGASDLVVAQRFRRAVRRRWSARFERIDVLSTPSQPDVAPPLGEMASTVFTSPFNALGWPAVSVPFATGPGGLPLATQLVGRPWDEAMVLRVARVLERAQVSA